MQQGDSKVPQAMKGEGPKRKNPNNEKRRMTIARSYREEADYYDFEILPFIEYGDIYRGRLKYQIGRLRDEARRLERRR